MHIFEDYLDKILINEGGWVNDINDSGKETYAGVSRKWYPKWPGWELIDSYKSKPNFPESLKLDNLLPELVRDFYFAEFWIPLHINNISNDELKLQIFDMGVDAGINTSIQLLQEILNVVTDGICGLKTTKAANSYKGDIVFEYKKIRIKHYYNIVETNPIDKKFLANWLKRVEQTTFNT